VSKAATDMVLADENFASIVCRPRRGPLHLLEYPKILTVFSSLSDERSAFDIFKAIRESLVMVGRRIGDRASDAHLHSILATSFFHVFHGEFAFKRLGALRVGGELGLMVA
jgi:hypothetical protein